MSERKIFPEENYNFPKVIVILLDLLNIIHIAKYSNYAAAKHKKGKNSNNFDYYSNFAYIYLWKIYSLLRDSFKEYAKAIYKAIYNRSKVKRKEFEEFVKFNYSIFKDADKASIAIIGVYDYFPSKQTQSKNIRKSTAADYKKSLSREKLKKEFQNVSKDIFKIAKEINDAIIPNYLVPIFNSTIEYAIEADDLIIKEALQLAKSPNNQVIIISADYDLYPLLAVKNINIYNPIKKEFIKPPENIIKHQDGEYEYAKIILEKLFFGDNSDNIKGIFKALSIRPKSKKKIIEDFINESEIFNFINKQKNIPANYIEEILFGNKKDNLIEEVKQFMKTHYSEKLKNEIPQYIDSVIEEQTTLVFPIFANEEVRKYVILKTKMNEHFERENINKNIDKILKNYGFKIKRKPDFSDICNIGFYLK